MRSFSPSVSNHVRSWLLFFTEKLYSGVCVFIVATKSNIRAISSFTVEGRLKSMLPDKMKLATKHAQVRDDYSNEGSRPWLCVVYDEHTRLRSSAKKSTHHIHLAPQEEAWLIIATYTSPLTRRRRSYTQHWSCSYKEARLIHLTSIIHAKWYLLHRSLRRMSIETKATLFISFIRLDADEARQNHGQVPTRPGHHSIYMSQHLRDRTHRCWVPTRR